jgi:hypothetical protein
MKSSQLLLLLTALVATGATARAQSPGPTDGADGLLQAAAAVFDVTPEDLAAAQRLPAAAPRCESGAEGPLCRVRAPAAAEGVCRAAAVAAYLRGEAGQAPRPVRYEVACRGGETVNLAVLEQLEGAAPGHLVHLAQVTRTAVTYNEARTVAEIHAAAFPTTPLSADAVARREAATGAEAQWRAVRTGGDACALLEALEWWAAAIAAIDGADEAVPAPDGLETYRLEAMVRIVAVEPGGEAGAWAAQVAGGRNLGLDSGAAGRVVTTARSGDPSRQRPQAVGTATLGEVGWGLSAVTLNVTEDGAEVREGDLVELRANAPAASYRSVWRELAELSIGLLSANGRAMMHPVQLRLHDSAELDHDLMAAGAQSIRATAERLRMSATPHWSEPLTEGRYRGESVVNAMRRTRPEDVSEFARYLLSTPGRFMGRDWPLVETYATWLLQGSRAAVR